MGIDEIVRLISGRNYHPCRTESELEDQVIKRLERAGLMFERQVIAGPKDRFDILVEGTIVLELKIKGGTGAVLRQIERYSQYEYVEQIIVVTTRASHRELASIGTIHGKRVGVIHVGWI